MKNDILKTKDGIFRILGKDNDKFFAINCEKRTMPKFYASAYFEDAEKLELLPYASNETNDLTPVERKTAQERFTMIAAALSVLENEKKRNIMIDEAAKRFSVSKQTLRSYLCTYLVFQSIDALSPKRRKEKELTKDQKNMRWALNKFFYTRNQNSLQTAYTMMLKEKYCDKNGSLLSTFPSFNQFRYFYRKNRKLENFYISREGIKDYQRNKRPLTGSGVRDFAPTIGTAMLDSTICDIYLVDDAGRLIGRPILVVACDANTSFCMGYSLLLEGGTYSLQNLMLNLLADKITLCEKMGINIEPKQWDVRELPRIMLTDCGSEYKGKHFAQIAELGITIINLPPYRPDLKGSVEKLFDLLQCTYKDVLKGKGVIMPDFRERGAHDYRKDAILTLSEFEKIVVRCIIYYNSERVVKNYPYTAEMLREGVKPYASEIWNYKKKTEENSLIPVSEKELVLTLLPRTTGKFTRYGLKVNRLNYYANGYKEQFLCGGDAVVCFNPDNCSRVWLKKKDGSFTEFVLIESRFSDMSFSEVEEIRKKQKEIEKDAVWENYNAKIDLISFIETVAEKKICSASLKGIRKSRHSAQSKLHKDIGGEIVG